MKKSNLIILIATLMLVTQPKALGFFGEEDAPKNSPAAATETHSKPSADAALPTDAASADAKPADPAAAKPADVTAADPNSPSEDSEVDEDVAEDEDMKKLEDSHDFRKWESPNYAGQKDAIGYLGDQTFQVPKGFEDRVAFWVTIYTKYSTHQGVMHDDKYLQIVYNTLDFSVIENDSKLSERQKRKAKKQLVKDQKHMIQDRLNRLAKIKDPAELDGEDLRYWKLFENIDQPNKFREAANTKRVRFQLGQSDRFKQGIYYSGRYLRQMEQVFREEELPIELTRLPFVESSFNIMARSKVGASGIWQFMRSTARLFKMRMTPFYDDRNDPLVATHAAARLMKMNYQVLGSWPLALTAYNHGAAGVHRWVKKLGTTDINEIVGNAHGHRFGFASENFYACFLAALQVERESPKYFTDAKWSGELKTEAIELPKSVKFDFITSFFDNDSEKAELYNPHLSPRSKRSAHVLPKGIRILIPAARKDEFLAKLDAQPAEREVTMAIRGSRIGRSSGSGTDTYRVQSGDTLIGIARQFGIKADDLINANNIEHAKALRAGQVLSIP